MATIERAYRYWVALACALLCWWAPAYVWASLSHRVTLPFPDRAQHAAQQDVAANRSGHDLTCNPTPTWRVGARDVGKAAAARRWVGASPTRPSERVKAEYGKGGRLLKKREWSYEYDARGRRTAKTRTIGGVEERTTYDWDGRDKLRTIRKPDGTRLDYSYDVFGRRVSKTRSGGPLDGKRVEFLWDGEVLAWELDTERGPRAFVHEPGGFEPILQQQGGETYLCVNDHLGMPKELIDGGGRLAWAATHSAYGKVIATQGPDDVAVDGGFVQSDGPRVESPFRLLGQVNDDDAELAWTRFRCFDAETGTWISTDPLELRGSSHLYAFNGSPTEWVDPLGLTRGKRHPRNAQQQLRDIPTEGRTAAEIERDLQAAGFTASPARSGRTVWTKPMPKGQTAAVRIDPPEQRAQPRGWADEVPHAHNLRRTSTVEAITAEEPPP